MAPTDSWLTKNKLHQRKYFFEVLVFSFAFLLFANTILNQYNLDDELVTCNHRLTSQGISAIPAIFTSPYYQDQMGYSFEYRPVVLATFAIEHQFFGDNAHVSHFINVLLYALCCLVLYQVLRLLFKNYSPVLALAISLLFAAHTSHTEVVASIKNRDEILGLLFSLLALFFAARAVRAARWWLVIPVVLSMTIAMMSKVTVVSFALLIPMALVLFTEVGILWLTCITIALIMPAWFLLMMSGGSERLLYLSGILLAVWLFYALVNHQRVLGRVRNLFQGMLTFLFQKGEDAQGEAQAYGSERIIEMSMPDKPVLSLYPVLITVGLAGLYMLVTGLHHSLWACLPLLVLLLLAFWGEEKISWWATVMIGVCLVYGLDVRLNNNYEILADKWHFHVICLYLAWQAFYGRKGLLIPSLLLFATANYLNITEHNAWTGLFPLILAVLNFKYLRMAIIVLFTLINISMIRQGTEGIFNLLDFACSLLVLLCIHFRKNDFRFMLALALAAFVTFHVSQGEMDRHQNAPTNLINAIRDMSDQASPKMATLTQYRPLSFIEECVPSGTSFSIRAGTSLEILWHYLRKVILPYPLAFYYGYRFITPQSLGDTIPVISLLCHLLLLLAAIVLLFRNRVMAWGIFIYLLSVAIVSNYFQPVPGMVGDRFLLIPSLGWCIVLVGLLQSIFKFYLAAGNDEKISIPARAKYAFITIMLLYSGLTFSRNMDWKDDLTLFRHDIGYLSESSQAHNLLGIHIMKYAVAEPDGSKKEEMEREALFHLKRAEEIYPVFFNLPYDIGRVYVALNMQDSAIASFQRAIRIDSTYPDVYQQLGSMHMARSQFSEAAVYLERLLQLQPANFQAFGMLSYAYYRLGQFDRSIAVNMLAVQRVPGVPFPYINIAKTYLAENKPDSARIYLLRVDQLAPGNPDVQAMLKQTTK